MFLVFNVNYWDSFNEKLGHSISYFKACKDLFFTFSSKLFKIFVYVDLVLDMADSDSVKNISPVLLIKLDFHHQKFTLKIRER